MIREVTFDSVNDRLVFLSRSPDPDYWEDLWEPALTPATVSRGDHFVVSETRRVLGRGARVIDAGCGVSSTVYGLAAAEFDAHGIDFAENTVATVNRLFPDLKVQVADVRSMPFDDDYFDGVWSLGVIEHFYDGFESIIVETRRVLRSLGYLFLTVPVISPLKKLKIHLGHYKYYDTDEQHRFFQFAFHSSEVINRVCAHGFDLKRTFGRSGAFGLYEDLGQTGRRVLPSPDNDALWARAWWRIADNAVRPLSHHIRYFMFQKTD